MTRKAVLVGINKYNGSPLRGCVNDVIVMHQLLTKQFGFKHEDIKVLTDYEATKINIINSIKWLTQGVSSGDSIVFHYSGHGAQVSVDDWTSTNETDGLDEILCSVDLDWNNPLRDHELGTYFKRVPKDCNTLVIMDCCLAPETEIPLLDGTVKTIKELSEEGGEYWVYSNDGNGNIVPGKAHSARITGYRDLIKITLDNGDMLECTEDHLIMLKTGEYKEAGKLTTKDSLMPLYRKTSDGEDNMFGYEMCFEDNKWKFTHHIIRDHFGMKKNKTKTICHHKDINKRNNCPENLQMVSWKEHQKMHGEIGSANFKKMWENADYIKWRNSEAYKKQQSYVIKEKWQDSEYRKTMLNALYDSKRAKNNFEEDRKRMIQRNKDPKYQHKCMRGKILKFVNTIDSLDIYNDKKPPFLPKLENIYKYFNKDENVIELANNYNHKINKIKRTNRTEAVYDLTVDKYHNFAINAGIFVHNCHSGTSLRGCFGKNKLKTEDDYISRSINPPISNILSNPALIVNNDLSFNFPDPKQNDKAYVSKFLVDTVEQGDAILLSGCKEDQTSADAWIDNRYQGAMTYELNAILLKNNYNVTYQQLIKEVNEYMARFKFTQVPQLECSKIYFDKKFLM